MVNVVTYLEEHRAAGRKAVPRNEASNNYIPDTVNRRGEHTGSPLCAIKNQNQIIILTDTNITK